MRKIQTQGVHHITLIGADRQTSIDFWEGVLGMPFIFEQPNLDVPEENHLYFDPGDGRLITVFTNETRAAGPDAATPKASATCTTWPSPCRRAVYTQIAAPAGRARHQPHAATSTAASWTPSTSATRWAN